MEDSVLIPKLIYYNLIFDPNLLAEGLGITTDEIIESFKDGRVASRFVEYLSSKLYGLEKKNSNNPGFDSIMTHPLVLLKTEVRTIGKSGIRFQQSIDIGGKRKCSTKQLLEAIKANDFYIAVDIQDFPKVCFIPIASKKLQIFIDRGELKSGGWSRKKAIECLVPQDAEWRTLEIPSQEWKSFRMSIPSDKCDDDGPLEQYLKER